MSFSDLHYLMSYLGYPIKLSKKGLLKQTKPKKQWTVFCSVEQGIKAVQILREANFTGLCLSSKVSETLIGLL